MGGVYRRAPVTADAFADADAIALVSAWPLFGLRVQSERLVMRLPTERDLMGLMTLARDGIHPAGEMPFGIAWSTASTPHFERGFLQHHWGMWSAWRPDGWTLNLLVELDGAPIGSQSMRADRFQVFRTVDTGSWLGRTYQGRGLGTEMRAAILAFAFDFLGATVAESSAFLDNAASNRVSRKLGYEENGRGRLAPEGVARETQRFRMTVEGWRSRPRQPVTVERFEECRELFGA
jgi:RimJ/RimL family protein N-acetyltransferase